MGQHTEIIFNKLKNIPSLKIYRKYFSIIFEHVKQRISLFATNVSCISHALHPNRIISDY